jgi:hypothetical protein
MTTTWIIMIKETRTYRMRLEATTASAAEAAAWEPLEEIEPEDIGAQLIDAYIDSVRARELYDHEKESASE